MISKEGKNPFGFICDHNVQDIAKDIFFSFNCIETSDKIDRDDEISFMLAQNEDGDKIWATNIRKVKSQEVKG